MARWPEAKPRNVCRSALPQWIAGPRTRTRTRPRASPEHGVLSGLGPLCPTRRTEMTPLPLFDPLTPARVFLAKRNGTRCPNKVFREGPPPLCNCNATVVVYYGGPGRGGGGAFRLSSRIQPPEPIRLGYPSSLSHLSRYDMSRPPRNQLCGFFEMRYRRNPAELAQLGGGVPRIYGSAALPPLPLASDVWLA
ncbi:hypothetical protein LY76DRAFT_344174 [Colletotrichum caudatum]|nr:hypothetical protein LY76DRAFT_344174 [Colletotrichum caudatum]